MESRVEVAGIHHGQDVSHLQVLSRGMEGKMDLAGMQHFPPVQLGLLSLSVVAEFQVIESHIWISGVCSGPAEMTRTIETNLH